MIEGFQTIFDEEGCRVVASQDVVDGLKSHARSGQKPKKDAQKVHMILKRLAEFGRGHLQNKEQFRDEGLFPDGRTGSSRSRVFAVKQHQLRVYGGFINLNNKATFACIEFAVKKRDRADNAQLMRVARAIGDLG